MRIGVMDYRAGNIRSVLTALRHLGHDAYVGGHPEDLASADRLIIPGDGEAFAVMEVMRATGLGDLLPDFVKAGRPVLGICIGCQIVLDRSEERDAECLGLISGVARRFPRNSGLKVPHMGWNQVNHDGGHPIFTGVEDGAACYFVHSYYPDPTDEGSVIGRTDYGIQFASGLAKDNLVALQFHPEKSAAAGLKMLDNFARWG